MFYDRSLRCRFSFQVRTLVFKYNVSNKRLFTSVFVQTSLLFRSVFLFKSSRMLIHSLGYLSMFFQCTVRVCRVLKVVFLVVNLLPHSPCAIIKAASVLYWLCVWSVWWFYNFIYGDITFKKKRKWQLSVLVQCKLKTCMSLIRHVFWRRGTL